MLPWVFGYLQRDFHQECNTKQRRKNNKSLNERIAKLNWNIDELTQRFNKERQTRNEVGNKLRTQMNYLMNNNTMDEKQPK